MNKLLPIICILLLTGCSSTKKTTNLKQSLFDSSVSANKKNETVSKKDSSDNSVITKKTTKNSDNGYKKTIVIKEFFETKKTPDSLRSPEIKKNKDTVYVKPWKGEKSVLKYRETTIEEEGTNVVKESSDEVKETKINLIASDSSAGMEEKKTEVKKTEVVAVESKSSIRFLSGFLPYLILTILIGGVLYFFVYKRFSK